MARDPLEAPRDPNINSMVLDPMPVRPAPVAAPHAIARSG